MFDLFQNVFLKLQLKLFIADFFFKTLIYNNIVNIDCLNDPKLKYRISIGFFYQLENLQFCTILYRLDLFI